MNPLSPLTYYRRHKRSTMVLASVIALVTLGVGLMVGVSDSALDYGYTTKSYLTRFSEVTPAIGAALDPTVVSQIRAHPDVAYVIQATDLYINAPGLFGDESFFALGVSEADVPILMDVCSVRLKEGRLPRARTAEIVLSEEVARTLDLQLGDRIGRSVSERYYGNIPTELTLVGILENDSAANPQGESVRVGLVSYEYLASHELYSSRPAGLIVVARAGRKAAVDEFLETAVLSTRTEATTYGRLAAFFERGRQMLYLVFGVVDCLVALVVAVVVSVINQIALTRRLEEFGLLHALGQSRGRLVRRVVAEMAVVAGVGWLAGLALAWLMFAWLKANVYEPRGMELNLANLAPLAFAVPIPLLVTAFATLSVARVFARLDAVAVIERGKLGIEAGERRQTVRRSSTKPLSSWTFYLRHRCRGVMLVAAMALLILGVAFPAFFVTPVVDAQKPFSAYLRGVGEVSPVGGRAVDPGVVAQIRVHPAVARVISAMPLSLSVHVPPATDTGFSIYGVSEGDLLVLLDLYGVGLTEGHLPRPRTNEVVLSEAIALNRGLRVGDRVGRPAYERDSVPVELEVVGLLSPSDVWLGFASLEYLESHELTSRQSVNLFIVPAEGRKGELDTWLEADVASAQTRVNTYETRMRQLQQRAQGILLMLASIEGIVAAVAAIALAVLNTIFFSQRREEFGTLHAMGRGRRWLVLRAAKETASAVGLAWLIGAGVCIVGLIFSQTTLYAPKGLSLDLANPVPWLFTLPIPLAVVAASVGTIGRMLSRLDPVTVIEGRQ